jgi:hypothetical protein
MRGVPPWQDWGVLENNKGAICIAPSEETAKSLF